LHKISIANLEVTTHSKFEDRRGSFERLFDSIWTKELDLLPQQVNISRNKSKGTLRGLHFQIAGQPEHKLITLLSGSVYLAVIDLRKDSTTFGKWVGVELSSENHKQLWVPPGFAHGFLVLSETAEFLYKTTDYYDPQSEVCLSWCDPSIKIDWPIPLGKQALLNAKDAAGLAWDAAPKF
jgi:dTDP-4-dehydrorhamnose 3,5-epimerase